MSLLIQGEAHQWEVENCIENRLVLRADHGAESYLIREVLNDAFEFRDRVVNHPHTVLAPGLCKGSQHHEVRTQELHCVMSRHRLKYCHPVPGLEGHLLGPLHPQEPLLSIVVQRQRHLQLFGRLNWTSALPEEHYFVQVFHVVLTLQVEVVDELLDLLIALFLDI